MTEMTENHRKTLEDMIAAQERMRTELMVAIRGQGAPRDPLPQMQPHIGGADLDPILEASRGRRGTHPDRKKGGKRPQKRGGVGRRRGRRRTPARAASIAGEGGDCSTIAAVGSRLSQRKIREERGGQKSPFRGPTPPPAVGRDSLVPGRPAGGPP
ncbi:hypothetical protein Sjap_004100 [Stephania japonica]|uniref:Uncharacterized protein n=1 Tax=Stephania japonica TaxID=461633 RepID=A0AAP0K3U4_9MAGN